MLGGLALTLVLAVGSGCGPAETALPPSSSATADSLSQPLGTASERLAGSSNLALDGTEGLGSFPAFMPPVALGADTQECQLGTDPYSTCI